MVRCLARSPLSQPYFACVVCCLAARPLFPALPLLPVWMNVSLTPWLLDFHEVWISGSSGCFLFLNLLLSFFWLCKEVKHFYLCLHPGQNSWATFSKSLAYQYMSRSTIYSSFRKKSHKPMFHWNLPTYECDEVVIVLSHLSHRDYKMESPLQI